MLAEAQRERLPLVAKITHDHGQALFGGSLSSARFYLT